MKKLLSIVLILTLSLSALLLVGCGKEGEYPEDYEKIILNEEAPIEAITLLYSEGSLSSNVFFPINVSDPEAISEIISILKAAENGFEYISNEKLFALSDPNFSISIKSGGTYITKYYVYDTGYIYYLEGYASTQNYQSLDKTSYGDLFDIYVRLGGNH